MRSVLHAGPPQGLADAWQALYERDARATPFAAPGWVLAWWRDDARVAAPLTLKVLDGAELVGLATLAIRRQGPVRVLFGAGTGVGNYWDVLAAEPDREQVVRHVAAQVARLTRDWDAFVVDRCEADSPLPRALADEGLRIRSRPPLAAPRLTFPATFDDYVGALSSKMRRDLRRAVRRVDGGELELREVVEPAEITGAVAHWHDLRVRWWRERDREINADHVRPGFARFAAEVMRELVPRDRAQVLELRHEGRRVGVKLNLLDDRTVYGWLGGFEPGLSHLAPGNVVLGTTIRAGIAAGRRHYDFMVGQEAYKYRYGAVDRWLPYLVVGSRRPRSGLVLDALRWRDARRRSAEQATPAVTTGARTGRGDEPRAAPAP